MSENAENAEGAAPDLQTAEELIDGLLNRGEMGPFAEYVAVIRAALEAARTETETLQEALKRVQSVGHNLDCLFCGWKDGVVRDALAGQPAAKEGTGG